MSSYFFFHFQSSSFQGFVSASLEGRISSCIFLRLRFSVLLLLCIFFSLHAFTSSLLALSRHAHTPLVHSLAHAQLDSGPAHHRGGETPHRGPLVGGDEPGSSALSPDIHTQWVHSHTRLMAWPIGGWAHKWRPLRSEDRRIVIWFILRLFCWFSFCVCCLNFLILKYLVLPGLTSRFCCRHCSSFPFFFPTAPITWKLLGVSQRIRCRCLFFSTCSHSLTPTRHLKLHLGWFPWNAKRNPHIFSQIRCSHGSHEPSTMDLISLTLFRSLSLLICFMLNRVLHRKQNSRLPRCLLELEPLCWHVGGGIEAVRSPLDRLRNQAGVFINLNIRQ